VGPYSGRSDAWDKSLAEMSPKSTVIQRQSTARAQESSVPLHPTSIEVILHIETLQVRVKSGPTVSHNFINWSDEINSSQLPAVVAYDDENLPLWGFGVPAGVPKVANLRALLEPDGQCDAHRLTAIEQLTALGNKRSAVRVIADFLGAALKCVQIMSGPVSHSTFMFPSHWSDRGHDMYRNAIVQAEIKEKIKFSFLSNTDVGAFGMVPKLLSPGSPNRGLLLMTTEGTFAITQLKDRPSDTQYGLMNLS
jgi:hypothetical protein